MRELGRALAGWLWRRSETRDITGVSLQETWLESADLQRSLDLTEAFAKDIMAKVT